MSRGSRRGGLPSPEEGASAHQVDAPWRRFPAYHRWQRTGQFLTRRIAACVETIDRMQTTNPLTHDATADAHALDLARVEEDFNQAMISNDVAQIRACITNDWVLVTSKGVIPGSRILHVVAMGELTHDTMTKEVNSVRV